MENVAVIGAGSFGTALADLLSRCGVHVRLWARRPELAECIATRRENPAYFPGYSLDAGIAPTADFEEALQDAAWCILAVPSQLLRSVLLDCRTWLRPMPLVIGAKGIETGTLMTMDEVARDVLGPGWQGSLLALSGPSFAKEILEGHPTALVLAAEDEALAREIGDLMFCDTFRAYASDDVIGVEMGGALKNIMAIAAGGLVGLGLGANTHAALVTRGLVEITRMAVAKGAHPMTLAGLAGMGDLVLTCGNALSRNRRVGEALGRGLAVPDAVASVQQVAEGVETTRSAYLLAQRLEVDVPIIRAVHRVLFEGLPARQALLEVVRRPPNREF